MSEQFCPLFSYNITTNDKFHCFKLFVRLNVFRITVVPITLFSLSMIFMRMKIASNKAF